MVRKLTNVLSYLDERLGQHSGRGPEYLFYCPACVDRTGDESSKRKLGVNVAKGKGGCFRCGFGFQSFRQLFMYLNGGRVLMEELALLRHEVRLPRGDLKSAVRLRMLPKKHLALKPYPLPPEFVLLSDLDETERNALRFKLPFQYLKDRGISDWQVEEFYIGYCPSGDYSHRLIFPVVQNEQVVYWTNRYCGDHALKSKNPPNIEGFHQRGTCLLNYDRCFGFPHVAIAEGPISAFAFSRQAFEGGCRGDREAMMRIMAPAMAMMGKFLTPQQTALIAHLAANGLQEVTVALDPGAGAEADDVYSTLLGIVPKVSMLVLTDGDPDDERERLSELMQGRRAPSVSDRVRQRLNG